METMQKYLSVTLLGKPNAGKSTLINRLVKHKVSIATHKAQTTRVPTQGIITSEDTQIVIQDTPGIFDPVRPLEKAIVKHAWSAISGADVNCIIIDVSSNRTVEEEFKKMLNYIAKNNSEKIILFNKVDTIKVQNIKHLTIDELIKEKSQINNSHSEGENRSAGHKKNKPSKINENKIPPNALKNIQLVQEILPESKHFFISATEGLGVNKFLTYLKEKAHEGQWGYDEELYTTSSEKFLCEEITREQLYMHLDKELPYSLTVQTDKWEQISENEVRIDQSVILKRNAHKKIVLGKNGENIKNISQRARKEIESNLNLKVHLYLFLKIRKDWDKKLQFYKI